MPTNTDFKRQIEANLRSFLNGNLKDNAVQLLSTLGYESEKTLTFQPNTSDGFKKFLTKNGVKGFNDSKAHTEEWESVDFLFQLTDEEISQSHGLFNSSQVDVSNSRIESYLFFAIELKEAEYKRSELAEITREINKVFPMPVMILFQHGDTLTFSIIDRRLNKRDASKDVLEKVTLIKDIRIENPHRAHIEILSDLVLDNYEVSNFLELHKAWQKTLDTKELNKKFFQELANWYFWAVDSVEFPDDEEENDEVRNATSVIRLITRLMFVWFLKEKGLVSPKLFDEAYLKTILKFEDESAYYKAILQNLFFATLNSDMGRRKFIAETGNGRNPQHFVHNVFRYKREFKKPEETIRELFEPIPFLNGGLFECLDKEVEVNGSPKRIRVDGFSDHKKNPLSVPDDLFFVEEDFVDLSDVYDDARKSNVKVRGLINILNSYKFTITENTPIEEEIALDPELLGRVFENLLASYNPETRKTARKQTGSFYTPREIVNFMVDESLIAYLKQKLLEETEGFGFIAIGETQTTMFGNEARKQQKLEIPLTSNRWQGKEEELEDALRSLFSYTEDEQQFNETETEILIKAIDNCKILDPACGSGAFPMGILHRLVHLLSKLDAGNFKWKEWQKQKALKETEKAYEIGDVKERDERLTEINHIFEDNSDDYGRKLFLIENCIYGVDIQPIAIQIAKLRFFISLIVDQIANTTKPNLGVRPLPNLETKFVSANTLVGLDTSGLKPAGVVALETQLKEIRAKHFGAKTRRTKEKYREKDKEIRNQIADTLISAGFPRTSANQISDWNPYDQNLCSGWFDSEWMFGIRNGFDIVIANPPYLSALDYAVCFPNHNRQLLNSQHQTARGAYDIFVLFFERGIKLMNARGCLIYINPNKLLSAKYAVALREFIAANTTLKLLVDVSGIRVFKEASVYPIIVSLKAGRNESDDIKLVLPKVRELEKFELQEFRLVQSKNAALTLLPENIWGFLLSDQMSLLSKFLDGSRPLATFGSVNATSTASEADQFGSYISEQPTTNALKIINTGTIDRYVSLWGHRPMTNAGSRFLTPYLPLTRARVNSRRTQMYSSPKVVFAKMAKVCEAFLDVEGEYASINTNCFYNPVPTLDLRFLTAFCNSSVFMFIYGQLFGSLRMSGGYFQFQAPQLRVMPLRPVKPEKQKEIAKIVDKIIAAKLKDVDADTQADEGQINQKFYEIYELSRSEIQIIEDCE